MSVNNTACFFGHRSVNVTEEQKSKLIEIIERLIVNENVDTFLFGSKSQFNSLCLEYVTRIKEKYPHIKRLCASRISGDKRAIYRLPFGVL